MEDIVIEGGHRLAGEIEASGAKNAALPIMAAALLCEGTSRLTRVPRLRDVASMSAMVKHLGCSVKRDGSTLEIDPSRLSKTEAPYDLVRKMRATIYIMGPLLARYGHAHVSFPGGCAIGPRPVDLHLKGLRALGARITVEHGDIEAEAPPGGLRGGECDLEGSNGSSVGATCNVLMAAVLSKGNSVLHGVAVEPEVGSLIDYLNQAGGRISGRGTSTLKIEGVRRLSGISHEIISDRIEVGTYLAAAALTGGDITIRRCRPEHLESPLEKLREMGVRIETGPDWIHLTCDGPPRPISIRTLPYPGFPTDLQAQFMAALALAPGESSITETIFPERFTHVAELNRLGANISVTNATASVHGVSKLTGAHVMASDLRASAALILAGLAAGGETVIHRVYHLDRGYEALDEKMRSLGALLRRQPSD